MQPLTQEEIAEFNQKIAALGPDQKEKKDEAWAAFTGGGDACITYVRNLIKE